MNDLPTAAAQHEAIIDLLGVYALHALDADEATMVETHLATCSTCSAEVERHLDVAAALGSMDVEPLRDDLLDDLLTRVRREASMGSVADVIDIRSAAPFETSQAAQTSRVAEVIAIDAAREARRHRTRRWRVVAAAAVVAGAVAVPTVSSLTSSAPTLAALAYRTAKADGSRTILLKDSGGRSLAKVIVGRDGTGYVLPSALDALPADRTYQLWAVTDATPGKNPVSAGLLGNHPGVVAFTVAADAKAYAISVEPRAGSTVATTAPIAVGVVV